MDVILSYIIERFAHPQMADLILIGVLALLGIYEIIFYARVLYKLPSYNQKAKNGHVAYREDLPPVSVIICARDEEDNLKSYLPFVLEQDYPEFEVIVVNDGSYDDTEGVLKRYMRLYPNLHTTFVPKDSRVISTKKLGLTLGIKAAKYDYIALIDADCRPATRQWLQAMMRNFVPGIDIVLGVGCYYRRPGFVNKLIQYDTLMVAMEYIGRALLRSPYMGVGRNLAYRKDLFFDNGGFRGTLGLASGDDDLFINRVANATNTRVEVSAESATWSPAKRTWKEWKEQKTRHLSVSGAYNTHSRRMLTIEPMIRGVYYMLLLAILVVSLILGDWTSTIVALVMHVLRSAIQLGVLNRTSHIYHCGFFHIHAVWFDMLLPIFKLNFMFFGKKPKQTRYGW